MSLMSTNALTIPATKFRTGRDSAAVPYKWARSDALLGDVILHPSTIREIMDCMAKEAGALAYTPEVSVQTRAWTSP